MNRLVFLLAVALSSTSYLFSGETTELLYDSGTATELIAVDEHVTAVRMSPEGECRVIALKFFTEKGTGEGGFVGALISWEEGEPNRPIYAIGNVARDGWVSVDVVGNWEFDEDFVVGFEALDSSAKLGVNNEGNDRSWLLDVSNETWSLSDKTYLIRCIVEYTSTGVVEELVGSSTSLYPNPTRSTLNIETGPTAQRVVLINSTGQVVYQSSDIAGGNATVNVGGFASGLYLVRIDAGNEFVVKQVVIE